MAGAKESPRNKLIALMYLVFITMLALNVSKEVLDGFGQMFKKIQSANERVNQGNIIYYDKIEVNAQEKEGKWIGHDRTAKEIRKESDAFYARNDEVIRLKTNESIYIHVGCKHQLINKEEDDLKILEVQTGSYFGEDDIVRHSDVHNRS